MAIRRNSIWFAIKDEVDIENAESFILSSREVPELRNLEQRLPEITKEYEKAIQNKANFNPYFDASLSEPPGSWDTIPLYTFDIPRPDRKEFPVLDAALKAIPGMVGCFFSRLGPHSIISRHSGITNAIFRCQAAMVLPSGDPQITGFEVAGRITNLSKDRFIAFVDANAHWAWNRADSERVLLIVDIVRPQFTSIRYYMSTRIILSYILLKLSQVGWFRLLAWFIKQRFSRMAINILAWPVTPMAFVILKILKARA